MALELTFASVFLVLSFSERIATVGGTGLESESCAPPPWVSSRLGLGIYRTPPIKIVGDRHSAKNGSALAKGLASGQVRLGPAWVWLEGKPFCDGSMGSRLGLELVMRSFLWRCCWHLNRDLGIAVLNIQLILIIHSSYVPIKSPRTLN